MVGSKVEIDSKNFVLIEHPLIVDKLTRLRNKETNKKAFQENLREISMLMAYQVFADLPLTEIEISTPIEITKGKTLTKEIVLCPILRAGLGLVAGFEEILPNAKISHLGVYRDEKTLQPQEYFFKYPNVKNHDDVLVYILDPMLATGGSALFAINKLKKQGIKNISLIVLLAAEETIAKIIKLHPDIKIYAAAVDPILNDHGYIVPGLGDAGDRIFGTK